MCLCVAVVYLIYNSSGRSHAEQLKQQNPSFLCPYRRTEIS
jgi:hypothetical protein